MKLKLLIPVYKRPDVFAKVMTRLKQIKSKHELHFVVCGDIDDECKQVYDRFATYTDQYITFPNRPISNKFNALYKQIEGTDFDYAIIIGSDDLISDATWRRLEEAMEEKEYHFIGFKDLNFHNLKTGESGYYKYAGYHANKTIGCYRALHKTLLNALDYEPFQEGFNTGIDHTMQIKMSYVDGIKQHVMEVGNTGGIVDIKSGLNIHSYEKLKKGFKFANKEDFPNEIKTLI